MVDVRRAQPSDATALSELAHAAYEHYVERIGRPPAPMTADYAASIRDDQTWTAYDADGVLGLLVLAPQADHLLLDNVAVHPAAQGRGVGRLLMELADREARRQGYAEVRLYTNEAMTENLAYYPRLGYVETHRAVDGGFRRVYFRKDVSPG